MVICPDKTVKLALSPAMKVGITGRFGVGDEAHQYE